MLTGCGAVELRCEGVGEDVRKECRGHTEAIKKNNVKAS
jgi:hypothetical protein